MKAIQSVLIIDDDQDVHFLHEYLIKRHWGIDVTVLKACDGVEAIDLLKASDRYPDLILLDINMPRMNGHEFLEAYSEFAPGDESHIIMLTSSNLEDDRERVSVFEFVKDYLVKPLQPEYLEQIDKVFATVA